MINDDPFGKKERDMKQRLVAEQEGGGVCVCVCVVQFGCRTEVDCVGSFEH